jgi:hypothetical protein
VIATVNDAFGAARSLARSLTAACTMLCVRLAGAEKRPLFDRKKKRGGAKLSLDPTWSQRVDRSLLLDGSA